MLFGSLFKGEKGITIGKRRKRKLTARDVIDRLNNFELSAANCTLIRDHLGNEKIENYGQVDVFRLRDEEVFTLDNAFCITTPTGMKLKADMGSDLAAIVSQVDHTLDSSQDDPFEDDEDEDEGEGEESDTDSGHEQSDSDATVKSDAETPDEIEEGQEAEEDVDEAITPISAEESPKTPPKKKSGRGRQTGNDAFSEESSGPDRQSSEQVLGLGQVIRLRFFYRRIPYEIDCQIVDRFNPSRLGGDVDLTPRFGVGYKIKPLTDVRNRDQRRYIRYTHRMGFGHLRVRNEIQFHVFAHRTNLEIPERGTLKPVLTYDDFKTTPFGEQTVTELKEVEKLEDVVEFFMKCMIHNPSDRRHVYLSKPYFDVVRRKSSLIGLGHYATVGAQQTTILPKIFIKKPLKGKTVLERMLAEKGKGPRDTHKMRIIEDIQDRYSLLTRELKVWQARRRQKRVESYDNDVSQVSFFSSLGTNSQDVYHTRIFNMNCELIDVGLENLTLKPISFDDARSRDIDTREFIRQEDGYPVDLLNFSVGGAQLRGAEDEEHHQAFLEYIGGERFNDLSFEEKVEALRKHAVLLNFYPILSFTRSQIQDYEPYLPFCIQVLARVARFRTALNAETQEPQIVSLGLEFIYNPVSDAYSRDMNLYDQWEQITPYTENDYFIEIHKSLQLLFGFDRALSEDLRDEGPREKEKDSDSQEEGEDAEENGS